MQNKTPQEALAIILRDVRIRSGMTQDQLAQKIGTKQESIARAESGTVVPSLDLLDRVAKALGKTLVLPSIE